MLQVPWNTVALQNCETATANSGTTVTQKIEQHHWKTTRCKTSAPCCKDALQCSSALATTCDLSQVHQVPKFSTLLRKRKMGTWSIWTGRLFSIWCSSEKRKRKIGQYGQKIKSWSIWTRRGLATHEIWIWVALVLQFSAQGNISCPISKNDISLETCVYWVNIINTICQNDGVTKEIRIQKCTWSLSLTVIDNSSVTKLFDLTDGSILAESGKVLSLGSLEGKEWRVLIEFRDFSGENGSAKI